jgi:hypothetical protein
VLPQLSAPCNIVIGPSRAYVIEPCLIGRRRGLALQVKGRQCRGTRRVYKLAPARHLDFLLSPLQQIIKSEGSSRLPAARLDRSTHHALSPETTTIPSFVWNIKSIASQLTMFKRSFAATKDRAGKARKVSKRSFRDDAKQRMREALNEATTPETSPSIGGASPKLNSAIVTIVVGKDQRLFAAHEDVLSRSPWFAQECRDQFFSAPGQRRISLPDEEPEIFSAVLEYLYKSDYSPRLLHDRKRNTWSLEDLQDPIMTPRSEHPNDPKKFVGFNESATTYHHGVGDYVLRDTVIYCTALRLGLPDLQRLALRKQGLQTGIDVATILRSARFAYANTPASDSRLRAHYLALIIRSRKTFKRSGTMQMEMEKGDTQFFFDLFVAMCNHIDDISEEIGQVSPYLTTVR